MSEYSETFEKRAEMVLNRIMLVLIKKIRSLAVKPEESMPCRSSLHNVMQ